MSRSMSSRAIGISTPSIFLSCLLIASASPVRAQNLGGWSEPIDGWDYVYFADEDQDEDGEFTGAGGSLDGTWTHSNGSDAWDGSGPGDQFRPDGFTRAAPGGAGILLRQGMAEDGTDAFVLGVVDIGDPRPAFPDPSNRKVWFCHDVAQDRGGAVNGAGALGTGLTIIARYRQMPDQNPQTPGWQLMDGGVDDDASQGAAPGYALRDGGKGGIGFYDTGLDRNFSFAPHHPAGGGSIAPFAAGGTASPGTASR